MSIEPITKKEKRINQIAQSADANRNYLDAIIKVKALIKGGRPTDYSLGELAFLYDHAAIELMREKRHSNKRVESLLNNAEQIYNQLIEKENNNLFALQGMRRILELRGEYSEALLVGKRIYKILSKTRQTKIMQSVVGNTYWMMGKIKLAEKWFIKDLLLSKNSISAGSNLYMFYHKTGQFEKAKKYKSYVKKAIRDLPTKSKTRKMLQELLIE